MNNLEVPDNIGRLIFPRAFLWFFALVNVALGVILVAGAVQFWMDPDSTIAWRVMVPLAGLSFFAVAAVLIMGTLVRHRRSASDILADSAGHRGIIILSSRRADLTLLIAIATFIVTALAGASFAAGCGRVVLLILAALLVIAAAGAAQALKRPRRLHLHAEGVESEALRSHTIASWNALQYSRLGIISGGGGQMVARFTLPDAAPGYQQLWSNRLELRRTAVDVEYMMAGVNGEELVRLVIDGITQPAIRSKFEMDKEQVAARLSTRA